MGHIDLLMKSIDFLIDDGKYSEDDIRHLFALALEDGVISEDEKRILKGVFETAMMHGIDTSTHALITELSKKYNI
ncbi:hypothetical protein [Pleionea sp. CnH1-48]|uniref:hypothetical protein n=1 Tax=Pleionea sp. CnH1-48 TaxID=2954494 RepID=UPI002098188D|nr:hypothetical protein [Pleionea sp. CnH1-48]MCO7226880.1 hypothetical protein [Pleionea sp. CnH1-48]